jgi:hypothetical protein
MSPVEVSYHWQWLARPIHHPQQAGIAWHREEWREVDGLGGAKEKNCLRENRGVPDSNETMDNDSVSATALYISPIFSGT